MPAMLAPPAPVVAKPRVTPQVVELDLPRRRPVSKPAVVPTQAPAVAVPQQPLSELAWPRSFHEHYQLGRRIGLGSYGSAFLANDRLFGRSCCVKVIPKTRGRQRHDKVLRKIAAEADFLLRASASCMSVVQLHARFEDSSNAYICTELCTGGDLERLVEDEGSLSEKAAARVLLEVLKVVDACHSAGFVHGDVKPANFVLKLHHSRPSRALETGRGLQGSWLKAIDFGCSQVVGDLPLTRRTGTPVFMAPELYQRQYSYPADLWSCGMMLYQLVSGRFPFWRNLAQCQEATLEEVIEAVTTHPVRVHDAPWLHLSPTGLDFMASLLQRDPGSRLTAGQALRHPWFREQLGSSWAAIQPQEASSCVQLSGKDCASSVDDAVWQAAQHVALRFFM